MIKKLTILILLIFLVVFLYYLYLINIPNSASREIKNFTVKLGWGSVEIASQLKQTGLIKNHYAFIIYVWQKGISSHLMSGDYDLAKNLNIKEVAQILSGGDVVDKEKN